jgi:hypothetical protein
MGFKRTNSTTSLVCRMRRALRNLLRISAILRLHFTEKNKVLCWGTVGVGWWDYRLIVSRRIALLRREKTVTASTLGNSITHPVT